MEQIELNGTKKKGKQLWFLQKIVCEYKHCLIKSIYMCAFVCIMYEL